MLGDSMNSHLALILLFACSSNVEIEAPVQTDRTQSPSPICSATHCQTSPQQGSQTMGQNMDQGQQHPPFLPTTLLGLGCTEFCARLWMVWRTHLDRCSNESLDICPWVIAISLGFIFYKESGRSHLVYQEMTQTHSLLIQLHQSLLKKYG